MKVTKLAALLAGVLLASGAYAVTAPEVKLEFVPQQTRCAQAAKFDQGVDLRPFLEAAGTQVPPFPARVSRDLDAPVWITLANEDLTVLGEEFSFPKRKIIVQSPLVSIFQVTTLELETLSGIMHRKLNKCGGFFTHSDLESAKNDLSPAPLAAASAYTIDQRDRVLAMLKLMDEQGLTDTITRLSSYKNRYYTSQTGVDASKWLEAYWGKLAAGRDDISVAAYRHGNWAQESVILTVRGSSEPQKIVVLGGHLDSISSGGDNAVAPGADDNASGIAALTEAIRVIVASGYRPSKTLKFMGYAAEEVGLRGSQEIAAAFKREGAQVEGVIQFDMTNFNGSAEDIFLITDNTNAAQNAFLGNLVSSYTDYRLGETRCGYACSDHASWTKNGFAASFPFESKFGEDNPNIHSPKDTISQSGGRSQHALKFAKLAVAYLVETAK